MLEIAEHPLGQDAAASRARIAQIREPAEASPTTSVPASPRSGLCAARRWDTLKLDSVLVAGIRPGSREAALAAGIVSVARALGIATVAEGIERLETAGAAGDGLRAGPGRAVYAPARRGRARVDAGGPAAQRRLELEPAVAILVGRMAQEEAQGAPGDVATNRQASFRFQPSRLEAGIVLQGSEVSRCARAAFR